LLSAEKRALFRFVFVFVALITLFLFILSALYYSYQKNVYTEIRQNEMINYAETALDSIFSTENAEKLDDDLVHDPRFDIALMDKQKQLIFPLTGRVDIPLQKGFFTHAGHYFYLKTVELDGIRQARYLVVRADTIDGQLAKTQEILAVFLVFSIAFFGIVVFILSRLFLRPLREYIELLDNFIRDATHELNTPISVLSMSLERIDRSEITPRNSKAIERMTVAIRTLSHLYDDLTFLMFSADAHPPALLQMDTLLSERIAYFMPLASAKQLTVTSELHACVLYANAGVMNRIVDNLLSNAIKYNKKGGTIHVILTPGSLTVSDSGKGFDITRVQEIFERYKRLDSASGGFGLGLSIVKTLCDFYGIEIAVASKEGEGSTFTLGWKSSRIVHA